MNKFEEIQINIEALYQAIKDDKKFFSLIHTFVEKLYMGLCNEPQSLSREKILFLATKIEEFFAQYRDSGDSMYIPPTQAWQNDDTVKKIFEIARYLSKLDDQSFQKLIPDIEKVGVKNAAIEIKIDTTKIFIVHGHDNETKTEVARFIEKLGFEAIILHEKASSGMTIIEKIESYSDVGFAVVLYTPDDVGAKAEDKDNLNSRARQNVIFEHGYLMAKIGRKRVAPVVKGDVELPNDISGVVYIGTDNWQVDLAKELSAAGYEVDFNKLFK